MFRIFTDYSGMSYHTYADDLQLHRALNRLSSCINAIHHGVWHLCSIILTYISTPLCPLILMNNVHNMHIAHMHKSIHYHLYCFCLIRRSIPFPISVNIASSYSPYSTNTKTYYSIYPLLLNLQTY